MVGADFRAARQDAPEAHKGLLAFGALGPTLPSLLWVKLNNSRSSPEYARERAPAVKKKDAGR